MNAFRRRFHLYKRWGCGHCGKLWFSRLQRAWHWRKPCRVKLGPSRLRLFKLWFYSKRHPTAYATMVGDIRQAVCNSRVMMEDTYYAEKGNWHKDDRSCCHPGGAK